jgi:methylglutaconyl-CoA hydratase
VSDVRVVVGREGSVGTITLNRPEKRNALDAATVDGLRVAFSELDRDNDVRVILLSGAGKDFCAGADLSELERIAATVDTVENLRDAQGLGDLFVRMRRATKPIIAAVTGSALAGGAGLAGACDIVLASDDAVFGYPEIHLGFVPAMVMALLRRAVGEKVAFELVARGDRISAADAHRLGLVNRIWAADRFEVEARAYAGELAERSASALQLTKRLLYGMDNVSFEDAIARGAEINALARGTEDCRTGVRRFLERRRDAP